MAERATDLVGSVADVRSRLAAVGDPGRATAMAAYMRDRFDFLGVDAPTRRRITADVVRAARTADRPALVAFADRCWDDPHRELQYVAVDVLRRGVRRLDQRDLVAVRRYVTNRSWWDTVDLLAAHVVGPLVERFPALAAAMDEWIDDDDIWVVRTAILHQLGYGERVDAARLFAHADRRAGDGEFFIRKALGWALRQHARVDPDAVREYVDTRYDRLSPLTRREALKHLGA